MDLIDHAALRRKGGAMNDFLVSLCTIAYNEQEYIGDLLNDFLSQTYPKDKTEIVLVDSASTDDTKGVFERFREEHIHEYRNIIIADNPKKIQAAGWNKVITVSTGDIIFRIDAHARIPENFVENNVRHHRDGEMVTGGVRPNIIDDETPWKRTLLMAESSLFGSSVADFRRSSEKKYVKSVFHAAYRREVFENAGLFNESLGRTEDNEMSLRIRDAGYKICLCPDIISYQHTRNSLKKMLRQKYGNGYWIGRTLGISPRCASLYHLVPFAFVLGIVAALALSFVSWVFPTLFFGLYLLASVVMSVAAILPEKKKHPVFLLLPPLFFLLHISYGVGTVAGLFSLLFNPPSAKEKEILRLPKKD